MYSKIVAVLGNRYRSDVKLHLHGSSRIDEVVGPYRKYVLINIELAVK